MNRLLMLTILAAVLLTANVVLAVDKIPDKLPNGERPWPAVPEADVQKIRVALPDRPQVPPQKPRKLLVFYRTDGFPHSVIPPFNTMLELLGEKTGAYQATLSQSYADLQPERLKEFDAVYFNNTCRMATPEPVKAALQDFVKGGKGFAGNHGAGDNWHDWPEGLEMIGAKFVCHPFGRIQIKMDDPDSPLTQVFGGQSFPFQDEIYAIAWIRRWGQGRVFYCSLGHRHEVTWDPAIVRFNLAGIQYALGDLSVDDSPQAAPASR